MARRAVWTDTRLSETTPSANQDVVSLMGTLDGAAREGLTVVRTIISIDLVPPTAVSDGQTICDMGIGVVSQEGFVSSVVPDPNIAGDRPPRGWLWRDARVVRAAATKTDSPATHIMADVRGARKVDNGELVFIINQTVIDGMSFDIFSRGIIRCVFFYP